MRSLLLLTTAWTATFACPSKSELYVAEILNWRMPKLVLNPTEVMH